MCGAKTVRGFRHNVSNLRAMGLSEKEMGRAEIQWRLRKLTRKVTPSTFSSLAATTSTPLATTMLLAVVAATTPTLVIVSQAHYQNLHQQQLKSVTNPTVEK